MATSGTSLRRRRLGVALRELRERAGMTHQQVGPVLDCSPSKLSRIENGEVGVRRGDLLALLDLYGLADALQRDELTELARESKRRGGWWLKYGDLSAPFLKLIQLESEAASIRGTDLLLVPGLLQTAEYARALIRTAVPDDEEEVERRVRIRLTRQEILLRPDPPELWVILDEAALHRRVGGSEVMSQQLKALVAAGDRPNVTIQVLPFEHGEYEAMPGSFRVMRFADPRDPDTVYLEGYAGAVYLDDARDVRRYSLVFDHLCAVALSPQSSRQLLLRIAQNHVE
ncbi:helix-turn-helix transcriptional regulator [Catellatospora sp. KI3]|uniref:helix-turn-helix domain-containing protein n=1 Tax=Catellatospora sp. KI3 TaxID=3041620 RepID=UPI00248294D8|nr:helix-turn-helix transcriptional regulator [Catellatospora sp. KI3]MDI1465451.1 helix-turn-helix transcriptional regulator [Catellatospora sp. KI3]